MPYTRNVPQANDIISNTQEPILSNFQAIDDLIQVDHIQFNSANQGKHNKVTMPIRATSPNTAANELALYTRQSGVTGNPEMVFRRHNNGSNVEFTTRQQVQQAMNTGSHGWTRLPSGVLLKWGRTQNLATNAFHTVNFAGGEPAFTQVFNIQITPFAGGANLPIVCTVTGIANTAFTVDIRRLTANPATTSVFFYAIGLG